MANVYRQFPPSAMDVQSRSSPASTPSQLSNAHPATLKAVSGLTHAVAASSAHDVAPPQSVAPVHVPRAVQRTYGVQVSKTDPAALTAARNLHLEPIPFPDLSGRFASGVDTRHTGHTVRSYISLSAPPQGTGSAWGLVRFGNPLLRGQQVHTPPVVQQQQHQPESVFVNAPAPAIQQAAKVMTKEQILALAGSNSQAARNILNEKVWNEAARRDNVDDIRFVKYNLIYKRPGADVRAPMASRIIKQRSVHVSAAEYGYKRRQIRSELFPGSARIRG